MNFEFSILSWAQALSLRQRGAEEYLKRNNLLKNEE